MTLKKQEGSVPELNAINDLGAQQRGADELSEEELQTLAGSMPKQTCTATDDSGMMGCPG
jgi:hypothetical protein